MYNVVVEPETGDKLIELAVAYALEHGEYSSEKLIKSFERAVASLEFMPQRGCQTIEYIPEKYRTIPFWQHLWLIYQIDEDSLTVFIDHVIDERSDYGALISSPQVH